MNNDSIKSNVEKIFEFYNDQQDYISQRIDQLLREKEIKKEQGNLEDFYKDLEASTKMFSEIEKETLVHDYLNILSYHYEFAADKTMPKQKTYEIKQLLTELALIIVKKIPNEPLCKQIEKLDALWEVKKDSHNADLEDEIQALNLLLDNEVNAYQANEPGSTLSRISNIENKINQLKAKFI